MISLTSIEEELINQSKNKGWADDSDPSKSFVVCVKELEEGRPQVILFTTSTITKEEVNYALRESGFGRIVKISEVRRVDELPLLGSGKINYRQLNEMIHA
jgi:long-chain-fatty-acid--[acyl-carrier-protein] ligase